MLVHLVSAVLISGGLPHLLKARALPTLRPLPTWYVFSTQQQEILFVFFCTRTACFTWRRPTVTALRYWKVPCRVPNC